MKIISWNVNGIRSVLNKGFIDFVLKENPDILCIQETKAQQEQIILDLEGYNYYFNCAEKKGYSGTMILTKVIPNNVTYGIHDKYNDEGRVITLEYNDFYLVNVYTPNSKPQLERLDYRMIYEDDLRNYLNELKLLKPVVLCGDLNVAHKEIDIKNPKSNLRSAGFTIEERTKFQELLDSGFIDTFRHKYPDLVKYTWWSYMFNARLKNIGWRIDYFVVSNNFIDKIKDALIYNDVFGSDHCPVGIII